MKRRWKPAGDDRRGEKGGNFFFWSVQGGREESARREGSGERRKKAYFKGRRRVRECKVAVLLYAPRGGCFRHSGLEG